MSLVLGYSEHVFGIKAEKMGEGMWSVSFPFFYGAGSIGGITAQIKETCSEISKRLFVKPAAKKAYITVYSDFHDPGRVEWRLRMSSHAMYGDGKTYFTIRDREGDKVLFDKLLYSLMTKGGNFRSKLANYWGIHPCEPEFSKRVERLTPLRDRDLEL